MTKQQQTVSIEHVTYEERVAYEQRILDAEMVAVRLRRLIRTPSEPGSYLGDTFYPVGGMDASHRWNGERWEWLPNLTAQEPQP